MAGYVLSESDKRLLSRIAAWWRQNSGRFGKPDRRNPRSQGGGNAIRRAKVVSVSSSSLTAYLYQGGNLDDSESVTVYCHIANGGSDLSEAIPYLVADDEILVTKLAYNKQGTTEQRWYCTTVFQPMDICT